MIDAGRTLAWSARIVALLFAAFLTVLAGDVFAERLSAPDTLVAFVIHLVPAALVVTLLVVAWRWPAVGGATFLGAGAINAMWVVAATHPFSWIVAISGPLVLIGVLFLASLRLRRRTRSV